MHMFVCESVIFMHVFYKNYFIYNILPFGAGKLWDRNSCIVMSLFTYLVYFPPSFLALKDKINKKENTCKK